MIEDIRRLIAADEIEEVIVVLLKVYPNDQALMQLSGYLNQLNDSITKGVISNDEIFRQRNVIRNGLINRVDELFSDAYLPPNKAGSSLSKHDIFSCLLLFAMLVSTVLFVYNCIRYNLPGILFTLPEKQEENKKSTPYTSAYIDEKKLTSFDNSGKKAEYVVFIVRNFNWVLGAVDLSERNGIQTDICDHLKLIGVESRINRSDFKGIICFGNTSVEENLSLPKKMRRMEEEDRAQYRSEYLSNCVGGVLKNRTPIYNSNLGQYTKHEEITDYQREIIIVGIIENEVGVINEEALFNGLLNWHISESWSVDIRNYSKVKEDRIPINRFLN